MRAYESSVPSSGASSDNVLVHSNDGNSVSGRSNRVQREVPHVAVQDESDEQQDITPFLLHRKLLRRRHVIKEKRESAAALAKFQTSASEASVGNKQSTYDQQGNNMEKSASVARRVTEAARDVHDAASNKPLTIPSGTKRKADVMLTKTFHWHEGTGAGALFSPVQTRRRQAST